MNNVQVAFDVKYEGEVAPVGYHEIGCHPIFDIKVTTITQKVRFVSGRHTMDTSAVMTYALVVSRESAQIALIVVALKNLGVFFANVHNAYLNVPPRKKACLEAGPEFGQ